MRLNAQYNEKTNRISNNIIQTNDENRYQSSDQNICARTFRTNYGLVQN